VKTVPALHIQAEETTRGAWPDQDMDANMSMTMPDAGHAAPKAGQNDGTPADLIKDTTTQAFPRDVLEESRRQPVLVDFWAPWCGPCKTLSPVIEKAVRAANGAVRLVKMNIDDHPAIAGQLGIQSIPAVIAFRDGQPVDGFVGALPEGQVKTFIERLAGPAGPSDVELLVEEGNRLLAAKDLAAAAEHFATALATDAGSLPALVGLAGCHLAAGNIDAARQTVVAVPASAAADPAVSPPRLPRSAIRQRSLPVSPPIQRIIRPASTSPSSRTPVTIARPPSTACLKLFAASVVGAMRRPASSSFSSSKLGARQTRRHCPAAAACRRCCFRDAGQTATRGVR
jgi:thioredoxin